MIKNIVFILKIISASDKKRIPIEIAMHIYRQFFIAFFGVFFLRTVVVFLEQGCDFNYIIAILIVMLLINFIFYVFRNWFYEIYKPKSDVEIKEKMDLLIYKKACALETEYFEDIENYDKYFRLLEKKDHIPKQVLAQLSMFVGVCFSLILVFTYVAVTDIDVMLIAIIPTIVIYFVGTKLKKIEFLKNLADTPYERKKEYGTRIFYLKKHAEDLRMTNVSKLIKRIYYEGTFGLVENSKKYGLKIAVLSFLKNVIGEVGVVIISLIYAVYRILVSKTLLIGDYVGLSQAILYISYALSDVVDNVVELQGLSLQIAEFKTFLSVESEHKLGECIPENNRYKITFDHASFKIKESYIIKNVSFEIKENEKIAIVGRNGAGKTTLINLLLRMYDLSDGSIALNDVNIKEYNQSSYRELFSVIPQDYHLYAMSINENVTMGTPKERLKMSVLDALRKSGISQKLDALGATPETTLLKEFDENGLVLSGGDSQKIALARLLVHGKPILVLDEPSSALDPLIEKEIFATIFETFKDHTIIFISHRLASTKFADRIYFMESGQIVEMGSHEQLMKHNGKYASLYSMQTEKYTSGGEKNEENYVSVVQ